MSAAKKKAGDVKDHKGHGAKKGGGDDAPQPGDKPKLFGGSPEGQKVVIGDIIDLIGAGDNSRTTLKISQADLLTAFQKQDNLSTTNLYRKQYGNLKEMFNKEKKGFGEVFSFDGDIVMLRDVKALESAAAQHGLLSSALLQKCMSLHTGKQKHDAETLRTNHENTCARCGARYKVMINVDGPNALCTYTPAGAGAAAGPQKTRHVPTYDFTRNANDVLACAISYAGVDLKTTAPAQPGAAAAGGGGGGAAAAAAAAAAASR